MAITFSDQDRKRLVKAIQHYFDENMEGQIGELKAGLLLDFLTEQVGPAIYNGAIADAQAFFQERVADLEGACHEFEPR